MQGALSKFVEQFTTEYPTIKELMELQYQLGIDQAGRGPVLGPMVYSALWWPKKYREKFAELKFADSKTLNEEKRQQLYNMIESLRGKLFFFQVDVLSAEYLSNKQQAYNPTNLNIISHNSAIKLLRSALSQGFKIVDIYVDTVGDPGKYTHYMKQRIAEFNCVETIKIQPKADRDFKVVSASSICAKVTRDRIIKNWQFSQKINTEGQLGSGYPGDPQTKKWLQNNKNKIFGFPKVVRFSWNTCSNILNDYGVLKVDDQDQDRKYTKINCLAATKQKDLFQMIK